MANTRHYAVAGVAADIGAQILTTVCGKPIDASIFSTSTAFLIGIALLDWINARVQERKVTKP